MASLWLMLFSISLICHNSIAKPTTHQENEYECVPIYKQSALQHPLMKNHRIQMRPSRELLSILSTSSIDTIEDIFATSELCPNGHVPIHKPKANLTNTLIHLQQFSKAGRFLTENNGGEKEKKSENNGGEKEKKSKNNGGEKEKKNEKNGDEKEKKNENNGGEKEKKKKEDNGGEKEKKKEDNGGEKEKKKEKNGGEKEKKTEKNGDEKEKKKEKNGGEKEKKKDNNGGEKEKKKENNGGEKRRKNNLHSVSPKLKIPNNPIKTFDETHLHYAVIKTNAKQKWRGAQAVFDIKEPHGVGENQFSKAWIWLNYGKVSNSIQFGWAVHTELYRDTHARLTTYFQSDKEPKGCYNALCPGGFVQIHKSIYPGLMLDEKKNKTVHLSVAEDPKTKNWVLTIGETMIGYWPGQTHMSEGASEIYYGGLAGSASSQTISPPMGNGEFPTKDLTKSCVMKQLKSVLLDYNVEDINSTEMVTYVDSPKCYGVMFLKYVDYDHRETLTFGGPGGYCRN